MFLRDERYKWGRVSMEFEPVILTVKESPGIRRIEFIYEISVRANGREVGRFVLQFPRHPTQKELAKKIKKRIKEIARELKRNR